jgi:HemY protein
MIRLLFALALAVALTAAGAWLADHPGRVAIAFETYRLDTSVVALAVAAAALMALTALLVLLWRWATRGLRERRTLARHRRGYDELAWGLSALLEGDGKRAARHARKFEALVGETALSDVLAGRAALAEGDAETARRRFRALEGDRRTRALALRGLLDLDASRGDRTAMLETARRALEQSPRADWAQGGLFDSAVAVGDWAAAERALLAGFKSGRLDETLFRRRRAAIRLAEARKAEAGGEPAAALRLAREAIKLDPALVPARLLAIRLYRAAGSLRRARALARDGWRHVPHPDLAAAWLALADETSPAALYRQLQALTEGRDSVEGHLALARQAEAAELFGQARAHLAAAAEMSPQRRVIQALEALERLTGNEASARQAAARMAEAVRDPAWRCGHCGHRQPGWTETCGSCGAFAALDWTTDARETPSPG